MLCGHQQKVSHILSPIWQDKSMTKVYWYSLLNNKAVEKHFRL